MAKSKSPTVIASEQNLPYLPPESRPHAICKACGYRALVLVWQALGQCPECWRNMKKPLH